MTKVDTIIFVEGTENDPIFYEVIAQRYSAETGRAVQVRLADELPNALPQRKRGGSGGKRTLVRAALFLEKWRGTGAARLLQGKEIAFCADKDVDDLLGKLDNCPAVVYTPMHSAENHIVVDSNLHQAICCAISTTAHSLNNEITDCNRLRFLSHHWKEWVVFCLVSLKLGLTKSGNYGQESLFNNPAHAPADLTAAKLKFDEVKKTSGIPSVQFDAEVQAVTSLIDNLIANDRFDEVFKGKWYISVFYSLLDASVTLGPRCRACGKNGLWIGIRSAFAPEERLYRHYANAFAGLR
jgi:hypothetical protein